MRRYFYVVLLLMFGGFGMEALAQTGLERVIKGYNAQISAGQYLPAARSAVAASALCADARNYDGAFKVLSNMEVYLGRHRVSADSLPAVFFTIEMGRYDLYMRMNNTEGAARAIQSMAGYARKADSKAVAGEMLRSEADFYYSTGQVAKGDECVSRLVRSAGGYAGAKEVYEGLIARGVSRGNAGLVDRVYKGYMAWADSVSAMNADLELVKMKGECDAALATIGDKERVIKGKNGVIGGLVTALVVVTVALSGGAVMYVRSLACRRRLKQQLADADAQSCAKSRMLRNMSAVIEPALGRVDNDSREMGNLRTYIKRLGEYSDADLAQGAVDGSAMEDVDLEKFCRGIVDEVRTLFKPGVAVSLSGCKGMAHIAPNEVGAILKDLLRNAAANTPANGKVCVAYRKRGAKSHQFVVTDSGVGVTSEKRETLFNPFDLSHRLDDGDILLLPVCAVRAKNINGTLALDPDVTQGASFVLTVRS